MTVDLYITGVIYLRRSTQALKGEGVQGPLPSGRLPGGTLKKGFGETLVDPVGIEPTTHRL